MRKSNYDKYPSVKVSSQRPWVGWSEIIEEVKSVASQKNKKGLTVVLETYQGVHELELMDQLHRHLEDWTIFETKEFLKTESHIREMVHPDLTDDRIFGKLTGLDLKDFFQGDKIEAFQQRVQHTPGFCLVVGVGASLVAKPDIFLYGDMARWEIQGRMRRNEVNNIGVENRLDRFETQYKWGYFVDWRVCDKNKVATLQSWDYLIDLNVSQKPKMIKGEDLRKGLKKTSQRPFRVVPFFDPGPWGGQWMKEVCDLDPAAPNFAWCFDCVPEENSLLLEFGEVKVEIPSINLVFQEPDNLLGEKIVQEFGAEFPIRFDFLDTMGGGNLSLQVHPLTQYIKDCFNMPYTQDESYYMLDAKDGAFVYLGLKEGVNSDEMIGALKKAQDTGSFDAEKFVEKWPVKKHDHCLIPAGTVHCSGADSMVLEISSTPYIFTFKLWDWGRLGLDGRPRPINIEHGAQVIQWDRTTQWTQKNLINRVDPINEGDGWKEERTGLHEKEFIETRRHWFSKTVSHNTQGNLNVLNLVEGEEVTVESPNGAFEPFVVHYAETFIVPASVGPYNITPSGAALNKQCGTVKAFVRP